MTTLDTPVEAWRSEKIVYKDLNARQQEAYNFQKVAAALADYGFNCIKLQDDWLGADFLALHKDKELTLKVQLKGRPGVARKYEAKGLHLAFPQRGSWYLIEHDTFLELVREHLDWLSTDSWLGEGKGKGAYHSDTLPLVFLPLIERYKL
jgi:hypothetical protein